MLRHSLGALARRRPPRRTLKLLVGAHGVPHRDKKDGEDAYFACSASSSLGVADGVGGSRRDGVDPGAFSRRLLAHARRAAGSKSAADAAGYARQAAAEDVVRRGVALLDGRRGAAFVWFQLDTTKSSTGVGPQLPSGPALMSHAQVCRRGGSSTLLVAKLADGALEVSNYGDSACVLLRPAPRRQEGVVRLWPRTVLRTADQTHYFNCPYQAAAGDAAEAPLQLGSTAADSLAADCRPGDVIVGCRRANFPSAGVETVAATDGFWDNVADDAAQRLIADRVPALWASAALQNAFGDLSPRVRHLSEEPAALDAARDVLSQMAADLADLAVAVFDDEKAWTPFSAAAALDGLDFPGGKEDDISVVVGLVADDATALSALDEAGYDNFAASGLPEEEG